MDVLSLIGLFVALTAIVGGNIVEGGTLSSLLNISAFMIVIGGTVGAAFVQTPMHQFASAIRMFKKAFKYTRHDFKHGQDQIFQWVVIYH